MEQVTCTKHAAAMPVSPRNTSSQDWKLSGLRLKLPEQTNSRSKSKRRRIRNSDATVMVIDDELSILDLFKRFFALDGVEVQVFANPRHALCWYAEHWNHIKIVFLDMKNPSMSGEDCFSVLQNINPGARIALISGNVEADTVEGLMQKGALCFFAKPFHYPTLITWALERLGLSVTTSAVR